MGNGLNEPTTGGIPPEDPSPHEAPGPPLVDIEQLVRDYHAPIFRYAFRLSGSTADAEDLTQQTFLQAHQKLHQLREPDRVKGWLYTILRTTFLKHCRQRNPQPASTLELEIRDIPEVSQEEWFDGQQLQMALDQLPQEARVVLGMYYFEQLPYKEIACRLDVKIGTVMSRLARAKSRLRARLLPQQSQTELDEMTSSDHYADKAPSREEVQ